jgi:hypothetical protein
MRKREKRENQAHSVEKVPVKQSGGSREQGLCTMEKRDPERGGFFL